MEKLRDCMLNRAPSLEVDADLITRSLVPLERMLDLSR